MGLEALSRIISRLWRGGMIRYYTLLLLLLSLSSDCCCCSALIDSVAVYNLGDYQMR